MGPNAPGAGGGGAPGPMVPGGAPGPGGGGPRMGPGSPGMGGSPQMDPTKMMAQQMQNQQQQMKMQANRGGGLGGAPGPGGAAGVDDGPVDVRTPEGAVKTFLSALKARDADRLSEATARRATIESATKNQELFTKIIDVSLPESELPWLTVAILPRKAALQARFRAR